MTEVTTQGLIDKINGLTVNKIIKSWELTKKKQELKELALYQEIEALESEISNIGKEDTELREEVKQILINAGLKKFEALDWTIVQLNSKPWALIIEDESKVPDDYKKMKTTFTIDKNAVKEDIKNGVIIEWCSISEDYTLVIKQA